MTTHPPSQTTILDKQRSKPSKTKFPPNLGQIPKIAKKGNGGVYVLGRIGDRIQASKLQI